MKEEQKYKGIYILVILIILSLTHGIAQTNEKINVKLTAFRTERSTLIRWVILNPQHWRKANTLGYDIERAEEGSENFVKLNKKPIKPAAIEELYTLDTASFAFKALAYTTIKPDYTTAKGKFEDTVISMMYILTTSVDFSAAKIAGSGYEDTTVVNGKKYRYKVTLANASKAIQENEMVEVSERNELIKPENLSATFNNGQVALTWDNDKAIQNKFKLFIIERAEDGNTFKPIEVPLLKKLLRGNKMTYIDKVENDIHYNYRYKLINHMISMRIKLYVVYVSHCIQIKQ